MVTTPKLPASQDKISAKSNDINLSVTTTHVTDYTRGVPKKYERGFEVIEISPNAAGQRRLLIRDKKILLKFKCFNPSCTRCMEGLSCRR